MLVRLGNRIGRSELGRDSIMRGISKQEKVVYTLRNQSKEQNESKLKKVVLFRVGLK